MIKAIILDVDGVIVGEDEGYNFPLPHSDVMERLKKIRENGIPISLCTSKPLYSVDKIITNARLDNLHIGLAGAIMIDPIDNIILEKHSIDPAKAKSVTKLYLDNGAYTELYTADNYYIQKDQVRNLTAQHTKILQKDPVVVESLINEIDKLEVLKVMPIAQDETEQEQLNKLFEAFTNRLVLSWAIHPSTAPHKFGNITAKGISKRHATTSLAKSLNIKPDEILGVGDGPADWQFMELCGYAGVMGNAHLQLKKLSESKGNPSFIGESVDENGILGIFDYFGL